MEPFKIIDTGWTSLKDTKLKYTKKIPNRHAVHIKCNMRWLLNLINQVY